MKYLIVASLLFACALGPARAEQSQFAVEEIPGEPRIQHPLPVPDDALEALQNDDAVKSCLADNPLETGKTLSSWFVASAVHLDSPGETDLIVVPTFLGEESMCFQTPGGTGLFWIFRRDGERYVLTLRTWADGLEVLTAKTNGYRNIRAGAEDQAGKELTNTTFHFDGSRYIPDGEQN